MSACRQSSPVVCNVGRIARGISLGPRQRLRCLIHAPRFTERRSMREVFLFTSGISALVVAAVEAMVP